MKVYRDIPTRASTTDFMFRPVSLLLSSSLPVSRLYAHDEGGLRTICWVCYGDWILIGHDPLFDSGDCGPCFVSGEYSLVAVDDEGFVCLAHHSPQPGISTVVISPLKAK